MRRDTGLPSSDAADDFQRERRRQVIGRLRRWLTGEPDDVNMMLPFDEVVQALGREGERFIGLQTIPLDSIVGSVDRSREFDRGFRPTTNRARARWQRIDEAQRRGEPMPPIDVYRVGDLHFVTDGHHRVSVSNALGYDVIDANVTEITTRLPATGLWNRGDIVTKDFERIFHQRVPLPSEMADRIQVTDPWNYAEIAENVEAWGFRLMQEEGRFLTREDVARRWFLHEYGPVVEMMKEADLIGDGTEAEAYMRLARERYRLIRAHRWSEDIVERLREPRES